ncbi:MAG: hypothetical protein HY060_26255, partial [Proteobacteria bacterium]|nr:hypothetical protein [Pseudomonadota bacterium]
MSTAASGTQRPQVGRGALAAMVAKRMFGTWYDAAISIACLAILAWLVPRLARWAFVDA